MTSYKNEKVAMVMIPYLRPDYPPLALATFKGILNYEGIASKMIDFNIYVEDYFTNDEVTDLENFCTGQPCDDEKALIKKLRKFYRHHIKETILPFGPSIVGMSLFSFFMQKPAELFCLELRKFLPEVKIFAGGSGVTKFLNNKETDDWSKIVIKHNIVDHVIIGEGENAFLDYIKFKKQGIEFVPQLNNFELREKNPCYDDIDISAYKNKAFLEFDNNELTVPITGSRGCVRKCSFCNVESIWPKYVFRSGKDVVDEMQHYVDTMGIKNFKFTDSLINGSNKAWRDLNAEIVQRGLDVQYTGQFIAKPKGQTTQQDYDMAQKAGAAKMIIGIESGSESVRNHMKKKFDNDSLYDTIENLSERNIMSHWMLITGYPTETDKDFEDTLKLVERFKKYNDRITLSFVSFVLLPDSPIAYQTKYEDLTFRTEYDHGEHSLVNYWICDQNPTLNFDKRLERFERAKAFGDQCGFGTNVDKFKKTIKQHKAVHETQILS